MTGVITYTLVLYLGFRPPLTLEGYWSYDDCKDAGTDAVARLCIPGVACKAHCIIGPRRFQAEPERNTHDEKH